MQVDHLSHFYLRDPCPFTKIKNPKNDRVYLFRENGALHGIANGSELKTAKMQVVHLSDFLFI